MNGLLKEKKGASNATAQLVSQLTNSADQALLLLESESFGQSIKKVGIGLFVSLRIERWLYYDSITSSSAVVSKVKVSNFNVITTLYT